MIQFKYDRNKNRYDIRVPQITAGDEAIVSIGYVSEDNRIIINREVHISLLRTIMRHWEEYGFRTQVSEDCKPFTNGESEQQTMGDQVI